MGLLDIGLPDLTASELARRIRAREAGQRLLMIAATGLGQDKDRQSAFDAGFDHRCTKPIDVNQPCTPLAP